ncbi:hypothetical protein C2869_03370 [Saccharobesus litoralis]|uniref:Uncharacterized protein n=1 Tax=Saccharobesus litoralis TaxID=2172099 RepID=A0A2S0VMS9_9ALTE|nr:hypothetical protein [Saccharobesus litoralis]AWB65531.1 hypothetical protein C2869_03370 [Saccharobesus litoralis]
MISKYFKNTPVCLAVCSVLSIVGCSDDTSKPADTRLQTADAITFSQSGTQADLAYTDANQLQGAEYNGNALKLSFKPDQEKVSGLAPFQSHAFTLTAPETILAPDPDKCPSEEGYMVATPFKHQMVIANVQSTVPGSGTTGDGTITSVLNDDTISIDFILGEGYYDMQFGASLTYADDTFDFTVSTPSASDMLRDVTFDPYDNQDEDGNDLTQREAIAKQIAAQLEFELLDVKPATEYADGQVVSFVSKMPVGGLSNFAKSEFTFTSDKDTYVGEDEEGNPLVLPVANVSVYSDDDFKTSTPYAYNTCASNGDYLRVDFALPDYVFDQTYRAQLTWDYEVVEYEMVAQLTDSGETVMVAKTDERGVKVVKSRETRTQIVPFEVVTEGKDTEFDEIDPDTFINDPRNSGAPLSTAEAPQELIYNVSLQGYNAALPVNVSATDADGNALSGKVLYSIDGRFFTDSPNAEIEPGQTLQIKVMLPETYVTSIKPSFSVGDETFSWTVKTKADPSLPVLDAKIEFPSAVSATASDTVTLRGQAHLNTGNDAVTTANLLVNGNPITSYDPATGIWTYVASMTDVEVGKDKAFVLTSAVDATITPFDDINLQPLTLYVRRLENKDTLFPAKAGAYTDLIDVTVDGRGGFPIFYMAEKEGKQVTEFKMVSSPSKLTAPLALYGKTELEKKIGGVAVNNYRPVTDGNYLVRAKWDKAELRVSDLKNYPDLKKTATSDAKLSGFGNTIWDGRQMVMSEDGNTLYVTGNDGIGRITMNYNLEGSPIQNSDSTTHRKWLSRKTFGSTTNYEGTVSADLLYVGEGDARTEYIITLAQNKGDKQARVYATVRKDIYDQTVPFTQLNLVDSNGDAVVLLDSHSIAVDRQYHKAYVAYGNQVAELDLANLAELVEATPQGGLAGGNTLVTLKPLLSAENTIGELSSIVSEGGLPYLVATDRTESALYAIDQITGEVVYLVQGDSQ